MLIQRSVDAFLGLPFNIASYALLTHMIAQQCNLAVGEFIHTSGDGHIYNNHREQVEEQLTRQPYLPPTLILRRKPSIDQYQFNDIELKDYVAHPPIKGKVAV